MAIFAMTNSLVFSKDAHIRIADKRPLSQEVLRLLEYRRRPGPVQFPFTQDGEATGSLGSGSLRAIASVSFLRGIQNLASTRAYAFLIARIR